MHILCIQFLTMAIVTTKIFQITLIVKKKWKNDFFWLVTLWNSTKRMWKSIGDMEVPKSWINYFNEPRYFYLYYLFRNTILYEEIWVLFCNFSQFLILINLYIHLTCMHFLIVLYLCYQGMSLDLGLSGSSVVGRKTSPLTSCAVPSFWWPWLSVL